MEFDGSKRDEPENELAPEVQELADMADQMKSIHEADHVEPIYDKYGIDAQGYDWNGWKHVVKGKKDDGTLITEYIHRDTGNKFGPDGYDHFGYDRTGRNAAGFDRAGFGPDGYNAGGWNREGLHRDTGEKYDPHYRDEHGFRTRVFDDEGYDQDGYDKDGYNKEGYNCYGRDHRGYDKSGWDWSGNNRYTLTKYDINGYNADGYNSDGYNKDGYNRRGYDRQGRDRDGYDTGGWKNGVHRDTGTEYNPKGFNEAGYDKNGFNEYGVNAEGYRKDGEKDRDVVFAEDFLSSKAFSKRDYAEKVGLSLKELDKKLKIAGVKCPKIESAIRDFLEANGRNRVAKIMSDCANFMDDGIDLYEFWGRHPRLSAAELLRGNFLPSDSEKCFFADKIIAEIELTPDEIERNLGIFSDTGYDVSDAIHGLRSFQRGYSALPLGKSQDSRKIRREHAQKIQTIEKYFKGYKSQDFNSLIGMKYQDASGLEFEFTPEDIDLARRELKDAHRLICKKTVQEWIVAEKKGFHGPREV